MGIRKKAKKKHSKAAPAFEKKRNKVGKVKRTSDSTTRIKLKSKSVVVPCQLGGSAGDVPTTNRKQSLQVSMDCYYSQARHFTRLVGGQVPVCFGCQ